MFGSLRLRVALSHAAVLISILVLLGGGGQLLLARSLDHSVTGDLMSAAITQANRITEAGRPEPPPDSDLPSLAATRIAVFLPDGSPFGEVAEVPDWLRPAPQQVVDRPIAGEQVRIVTIHVVNEGRTIATVVSGRSLAPEATLLHRVRLLLLTGGLVAVILALLTGWWLAGRAVRPIERAYEAQAGFAGDASHELRTPLTFIRSGVEVLAERDPALGSEVLKEVDYLAGLTQRMLTLARSDGRAIPLERATIDLSEVCRSAIRRSEHDGVRVHSNGNGNVEVVGDRYATEAALDAVLENVRIHGGAEADMSWRADSDRGLISIRDHGPGLSSDERNAAFDRFYRGDPSRARETGGAGLGLALSRSLIEAQGGAIWLEETPGGGLTARISLPTDGNGTG
ncbi:MAG: HAMP domain-containing histidine kinase [Actinomycetota bacterium]|nr:HAMP domain-containing histidine kinase [Actinomycetota bacterium]